jgi:hypothetical protein
MSASTIIDTAPYRNARLAIVGEAVGAGAGEADIAA